MRHVRHVSLDAPDEASARRAGILLEDALRTASVPFEDRRLLVVRRLPLGVIDTTRPSSSIALRIQHSIAGLAGSALPADDPRAPFAPAVYFRDEIHPFVAAAVALTRSPAAARTASLRNPAAAAALHEWFWQPALASPVLAPLRAAGAAAASSSGVLRLLIQGVSKTSGGALAVVTFLRQVLERSALDPLLAGFTRADAEVVLPFSFPQLAGGFPQAAAPTFTNELVHRITSEIVEVDKPRRPHPSRAGAPQSRVTKQTQFEPNHHWITSLRRWVPSWSPDDPRSLFLASAALAASHPSLLSAAYLPSTALSLLHSVSPTPPAPPPAPRHPKLRNKPNSPSPVSPAPPRSPAAPLPEAAPAQPEAAPLPLPTGFAGLYFILPVLERLGLPAVVSEDPAYLDLPVLLLQTLARRLRVPPDDPILAPFVGQADGLRRAAGPPPATPWLLQTALWLRRHARIGLRALVRRPGRIAWTPTHIDLFLPLRDADIRIRRTGLDIDPGWLPWLGRIIHYHYH